MAIIACHECQNEVSTEAKNCPRCGANVRKPPRKRLTVFGFSPLALAILGVVGASAIFNAVDHGSAGSSSPKSTDELLDDASTKPLTDAALGLIRAEGYACPALGNVWNRGVAPEGLRLEVLCGPDSTHVNTALHYAVYPEKLIVRRCEPWEIFGRECL